MNKRVESHPEKQADVSQSILTLIVQWINRQKHNWWFPVIAVLIILLMVTFFVLSIMLVSRQFENSWYSLYFLSQEKQLGWELVLIIGITVLRDLYVLPILILSILAVLMPENSRNFNLLNNAILKLVFWGVPVVSILIGLQNLVLYNTIGWEHLNIIVFTEGVAVSLFCAAIIIILFGSKFQSTKRTAVFESLFNFVILALPVSIVIGFSIGGFKTSPLWLTLTSVLVSLVILILGVEELKGRPTIYTYFITTYRILESGYVTVDTLRKKSAEALADALKVYKRLPEEQQNILAKWILDNNEPSFLNRFWAISKIIVSTILLTMLVQEPAIILLKWFLKTVFNFSY